jgi:two-component system CheB/CheR fusion protein
MAATEPGGNAGANALDAASRLGALRATGALDSPPEESFDRLTRLAARVLRCPVALVSLVDADRQFFKSCVGLPEPWRSRRQTALSHSFCQHAVTAGQPLVIEDARRHPLVKDNLAVRDLGVIAYAGIPLRSAGEVLGSFCAIDTEPRQWSADEVETLVALAGAVEAELELRRAAAEQRAQREQAERERSLTLALLDSSREGIYGLDGEGRCTFVNHAAARMFGEEPAALVGRDLRGVLGSELEAALNGGGLGDGAAFVCGDGRLRRRDGSSLTVAYSSSPLVRGGEVCGVVVAMSDVTERREAEKALRQANYILRAVVDGSSDAIFVKDADGRYVMMNAAGAAIVGRKVEDVVGRDDAAIFDADTAARVMAADRQILRTGESTTVEHAYTPLAGGGELTLQTSKAPYRDDAGNVVGVIGVARDVTRRKRAEDALKLAKEQAESANRSKDQFLAVLSHELRSPLSPVLALASAGESDPSAPPALREDLSMIRRNVELEVRLIDDLLDLTRIARGKLRLAPQPVDAHALLRHAVRTCPRAELVGRQLTLEAKLAAGQSFVNVDAGRFQQVLWNLLNNAIKFTPDGGRITVRTWNEPGDDPGKGPGAVLGVEVADTGIGIDAEHLPRVFDAFQQGEDGVTRRFGGLGLGLAICKALITAMGGTNGAASDGPGKGATFRITLPTCAAVAEAAGEGAAAGGVPGGAPAEARRALRILLVEDHADTSRAMSRLLTRVGHQVRTAGTVRAAVDAARAAPVDVVISDLGLPDGTGHDVIRLLRALGPLRGIALSGYGTEDDIRKSHEAGFDTHLTKPTDFGKLVETIEQLARK